MTAMIQVKSSYLQKQLEFVFVKTELVALSCEYINTTYLWTI